MKAWVPQIRPGGGWMLVHPVRPDLAWTGAWWTKHKDGAAINGDIICTFTLLEDANRYAAEVAKLRSRVLNRDAQLMPT